jgi:hypothetical protein
MKRLTLVLGLVALAFTATTALAAPSGRGSGGSRGGSHFSGGSHGGSHGSRFNGGSRGSRFGGGSHFRSRIRVGVGFGYWYDPFWYDSWYGPYPYRYGYYGYPYGYRYGYGGGYGYAPSREWAVVDTDVSPESARVYVDGQLIGTADDFDGYPDYLYLRRGHYRIEFRLPGYQTRAIDVDARPGTKVDVDDKLAKIPGSAQYGSYDDPLPSGEVRRFWGKRGNATAAITGDDEIYGSGPRRYRERPRDRDDEYYREDRDQDRDDDDVDVDRAPAETRPAPRDDGWRNRSEGHARMEHGDTWLHLNVHPTDAAIYLDDRFIGTASELDGEPGIAVPPGSHTIVVSRPGYRDKRVPVNVSRGETEKVDVQLER